MDKSVYCCAVALLSLCCMIPLYSCSWNSEIVRNEEVGNALERDIRQFLDDGAVPYEIKVIV